MIFINDHRHGHALCRAMGSVFTPTSETVISHAELRPAPGYLTPIETLLGGVLYEKYTGTSVMMHTAGLRPNWLNRELLWIAFDYPFRKLDCIKVIAVVASTNAKAIAFAEHLGFTLEAKIENAVPGGDTLILSMERKDCRWLTQPRNMRRPVLGRAVELGQFSTQPIGSRPH